MLALLWQIMIGTGLNEAAGAAFEERSVAGFLSERIEGVTAQQVFRWSR
jgi:hypothetical protein